jgi:hypothetical protein
VFLLVVAELGPHLQLIVYDHANPPEGWFPGLRWTQLARRTRS